MKEHFSGTERTPGLYLDALALACMGREQEAMALLWTRKHKFSQMPDPMQSLHAYLEGDTAKGLAILRDAQSTAHGELELRFYMARQASRFGDLALANKILLRSVEEGYWNTTGKLRDPWLESLRATPEFDRTLDLVKTREAQSREAFLKAGGEQILSCEPSEKAELCRFAEQSAHARGIADLISLDRWGKSIENSELMLIVD